MGVVDTIAATIQQFEGWFPPGTPGYPNGSYSWRNNNPGNLVYWGGPNQKKDPTSSFAVYPSYALGYQALLTQINFMIQPGYTDPNGNNYPAGVTLNQMMEIYAPLKSNPNQPQYIAAIASATGCDPSQPVINCVNGTPSGSASDNSSSDNSESEGDYSVSADPTAAAPVTAAASVGLFFPSLPAVVTPSDLGAWFSSLDPVSMGAIIGVGALLLVAIAE